MIISDYLPARSYDLHYIIYKTFRFRVKVYKSSQAYSSVVKLCRARFLYITNTHPNRITRLFHKKQTEVEVAHQQSQMAQGCTSAQGAR